MNYRIEVFNKETDEHIENIDFEAEGEETAIDELEELSTIPAGDAIDQDGFKYELQLWWVSESRTRPDEFIESGYTNEFISFRQFYCVWCDQKLHKHEINFIDFFSSKNGYSDNDLELINSLEIMGYVRLSTSHAVMRIS